jgi:type II secretion system (T2SS) protein M
MTDPLARLRHELGPLGLAALLLFAAAAAFHLIVLKPLQARTAVMEERVARQGPRSEAPHPASSADKLNSVYDFLRSEGETTDWLAKLHGIGAATGVQLKSASYRSQPTESRIQRYEIVVPVSGSYPQIREFLRRSLAEIPVLSIDQLTLRRESRNDGSLQAELRMTLHMVKS